MRPDWERVLAEHYTWQAVGHPGDGWACICGEHLGPWWPTGGVRMRESALDVALRSHLAAVLDAALGEWLMADETRERVAEVLLTDYASEYDASHLTWRDFDDPAQRILATLTDTRSTP